MPKPRRPCCSNEGALTSAQPYPLFHSKTYTLPCVAIRTGPAWNRWRRGPIDGQPRDRRVRVLNNRHSSDTAGWSWRLREGRNRQDSAHGGPFGVFSSPGLSEWRSGRADTGEICRRRLAALSGQEWLDFRLTLASIPFHGPPLVRFSFPGPLGLVRRAQAGGGGRRQTPSQILLRWSVLRRAKSGKRGA